MSSQSLQALWEASAGQPFAPAVSKDQQFSIAFFLLLAAFLLSSLFGLSAFHALNVHHISHTNMCSDLSLKNIPLFAVPASFAFGYASVPIIEIAAVLI